ncbi:cupin domain-containing protein [Microbacterium sp. X-17]|uniref:cupin domain-containing protein n=1 Tax=Microbacterium sp. X-17 TaxID=3144404 RepID=UPI0031F4BE53
MTDARTRLVVVGTDGHGRSLVVSDGPVAARVDRPRNAYPNMASTGPDDGSGSDYYAEELWRIDRVPASAAAEGSGHVDVAKYPPPGGVSVRKLSLPPTGDHAGVPDLDALLEEFGPGNVSSPEDGAPVLHRHPCLHVITFLSGACYFILRTGEVYLEAGDCIVLRGDMHDWRNPFDAPAVILATIVRLEE